jgi:hypothetical protein
VKLSDQIKVTADALKQRNEAEPDNGPCNPMAFFMVTPVNADFRAFPIDMKCGTSRSSDVGTPQVPSGIAEVVNSQEDRDRAESHIEKHSIKPTQQCDYSDRRAVSRLAFVTWRLPPRNDAVIPWIR